VVSREALNVVRESDNFGRIPEIIVYMNKDYIADIKKIRNIVIDSFR
jgi:hypothetical protein